MATKPPPVRRVRVFRLTSPAWEQPAVLEKAINATLLPDERIVGCIPGPKLTAFMLITEQP